jgi:NADH:ubiquinone oxidoreductase subunit 4 (subunit M)
MLRAYRSIFFGERPNRWANVKDVTLDLGWPVLLLLAGLLFFGFAPQTVLQKIEPGMALFWK